MMPCVVVGLLLLLAACASMGRPGGGPRDTRPPRYVRSNPAPGAVNHTKPKLEIIFDENVKVEEAMKRVVVSPAQRTPPSVFANGRRVTLELRDSLLSNTTYTIDFSDAIRDLNEGNILDGFAIDFSTGPTRDSLQISGLVLEAHTLEPAQGMLVGAYRIDNLPDTVVVDSLIMRQPFDRIAKTNQLGQFTLRNLKEGTYRVYAVNDVNRDYYWDRSEDVAFYEVPITPGHEPGMATDTLTAVDGTDSIVTHAITHFTPDDVLLTWFNENYRSQYLRDYKRPTAKNITMQFGAPSDTLPDLVIANGPNAGRPASEWALIQANATNDSITYWITDEAVIAQDSILMSTTYLRTDSTNQLSAHTDTLKMYYRAPKVKDKKKKKDDEEINDSIPPINHITLKKDGGSTLDLNKPLVIKWDDPLGSVDRSGYHLSIKEDTIWKEVPLPPFPDIEPPLRGGMRQAVFADTIWYNWNPGASYRLAVDSAAVTNIYGEHNDFTNIEFKVKNEEDYSTLIFNITPGIDQPIVVELLNSGDSPVAQSRVNSGSAVFNFVDPGTYFARAYIDANGNGKWDAGKLMDSVQPEEVYYYPKKINARANWDIEQSWNIYELPLDMQKPLAIKKNKPVTKEKSTRRTDDDEDDDEFDNFYQGGGNQYDYNHRGSSGISHGGGLRNNNSNSSLSR